MRCLICNEGATYATAANGPLCKNCWLGLKMFQFNPELIARARKYQCRELKSQKGLNRFRKEARKNHATSVDAKFAQIVREELRAVELPPVEKSRTVKIVKWYNRKEIRHRRG